MLSISFRLILVLLSVTNAASVENGDMYVQFLGPSSLPSWLRHSPADIVRVRP
jgi:hypothetical protein